MTVEDPALRAAIFLHNHPGWSPRDLETADPDLIELMRQLDAQEAQVAASRVQAQKKAR